LKCASVVIRTVVTLALFDGSFTPVAPQTPEQIAAQLLTRFRGQHIGLLSPLVMNRKGVYTELADWARPRGFTHLRVDGNFLPTTGFPRIDRF
jgi:excinuclease ABC subunit A